MNDTIGVVKACEKKQELSFIYKWQIEDFFSLPQTENISYCSPSFIFFGATWSLKVYPNGRTDDADNDRTGVPPILRPVNIYLVKLHPRNENCHVKCSIGIQDTDGDEYDSSEIEDNFGGNDCERGIISFIEVEDFRSFDDSEEFFIIFCNFHVVFLIDVEQQEPIISRFPRSFPRNKQKITNILCKTMENLYLNQKHCDVILDVSGQEFRAHKLILSARCVVFSNMFETEMAENFSGRVNIQDVDPNVFKNVLIHIYSGEIKELSLDSVFEYYKLADKFQLAELREACLEFVENNMSSANVFNFFLLSDRHDDTKLRDIAKKFMAENITEVMSTAGWAMLKIHNHTLSLEILEMAVHDRK